MNPVQDRPGHILIVDDTPVNLEVMVAYLAEAGFQTMVARTGETGVAIARREHPALILLDVMLPGIDGFEVCRRLKTDAQTRAIPVIFMTAVTNMEGKVRGFQAGGVDYITKPFQPAEVLARVATHLTLHRLQQDLQELNRALEEKVAARTAELASANATLLADIEERRQIEAVLHASEQRVKAQNVVLAEAVQQKQQEMEALFARLLRQEKLATIGQMAASIAHELRNPLGAVKQSVYYLKRLAQAQELTASNPKVLRHLDLIDAELNTSARVIAGLLDMTRLKPPQRVLSDLGALLAEAITRSHLPEQVRVTIVLEPDPFVIYADALQLRQVVLNVLTNAAQAIEGEGAITIHAHQLNDAGESVIAIHDTGVGIAPEAIPNVFEPLYTTKATGTGLGLSLCKHLIESHQGRISLTSQPGQGTTVIMALPDTERAIETEDR